MDSSLTDIPISAIQAYHSRERKLFSRMVLDLCMEPIRSMELIALWLWLEEQDQKNAIDLIISYDDPNLQAIARSGGDFIDALCLNTPPDQLSVGFQQNAVNGIKYYLNTVCLKAFSDILKQAEDAANLHQIEMLIHQVNGTCITPRDIHPDGLVSGRAINQFREQPYVPHGEGSSRSTSTRFLPLGSLNVERGIRSGYHFTPAILRQRPSTPLFSQIGYGLPVMTPSINVGMGPRSLSLVRTGAQQSLGDNIPRDERTLFVTFSNGYPLTNDELCSFFLRYYGDVESVNIQKPKDDKPPLYAYVSFHKLATVLCVLNGAEKVKFIINGKHLWARRYIPRRNQ